MASVPHKLGGYARKIVVGFPALIKWLLICEYNLVIGNPLGMPTGVPLKRLTKKLSSTISFQRGKCLQVMES